MRLELLKAIDAVTAAPVTWLPDAKQLAVRSGEATEIWDIEANECVRRFDGDASLVRNRPKFFADLPSATIFLECVRFIAALAADRP